MNTPAQRFSVDRRPKRIEMCAFSNEKGITVDRALACAKTPHFLRKIRKFQRGEGGRSQDTQTLGLWLTQGYRYLGALVPRGGGGVCAAVKGMVFKLFTLG